MAKRQSKTRTSYAMKVFQAALLTAICVLPGFTCSFEPSAIGRHPDPDDEDAGDSE